MKNKTQRPTQTQLHHIMNSQSAAKNKAAIKYSNNILKSPFISISFQLEETKRLDQLLISVNYKVYTGERFSFFARLYRTIFQASFKIVATVNTVRVIIRI